MRLRALMLPVVLSAALCAGAHAATLNSAKVTQVQNDVRLDAGGKPVKSDDSGLDPAPPRSLVRKAAIGDVVEGTKTLLTGKKSRAELLFNDQTVARLGANSVFSFKPGSRDVKLQSGFLLLHTPKGKGGAKISTPSASASVLGTTVMLAALPEGGMKLAVLEGVSLVSYNGVTQQVQAGQLVFLTPDQGISPPITINLQQLVASSGLFNNFKGKIGSEQLIQNAIKEQAEKIADGELEATGFKIGGDAGGLNVIQASAIEALLQQLDTVQKALAKESTELGEDLSGSFNISPPTEADFGVPQFSNGEGQVLQGVGTEGGTLAFLGDRFHFTDGPPINVTNNQEVGGLAFIASGQSVNYVTSFNAIRFDNFQGTLGGDNLDLIFAAARGGIGVFNSSFEQGGNLFFHAAGQLLDSGNVELTNSHIFTTGAQVGLSSAGGNVLVNNSTINIASNGGSNVLLDAPAPGGTVTLQNSTIDTTHGSIAGGVFVSANADSGTVNLINSTINAGNTETSANAMFLGNTVNLFNTTIAANSIVFGNPVNPTAAVINIQGLNNLYVTAGQIENVQFSGQITGSGHYNILPLQDRAGALNELGRAGH